MVSDACIHMLRTGRRRILTATLHCVACFQTFLTGERVVYQDKELVVVQVALLDFVNERVEEPRWRRGSCGTSEHPASYLEQRKRKTFPQFFRNKSYFIEYRTVGSTGRKRHVLQM